jgi:hypothetical protein
MRPKSYPFMTLPARKPATIHIIIAHNRLFIILI